MANRAVWELIGLFTIAWILILVGAVLVFRFVVPQTFSMNPFLNGVFKTLIAGIISVLWIGALIGVRNFFVRNRFFNLRVRNQSKASS